MQATIVSTNGKRIRRNRPNLSVGVGEGDVEHLGEVLTKRVRGGTLDATTADGNESLDSGGVQTASKLFLLGLVEKSVS